MSATEQSGDPVFTLNKSAAVRGGAKGGQYLQSIGITDLAKLNVGQFEHFCFLVVAGACQAAIDDAVTALEHAPPF